MLICFLSSGPRRARILSVFVAGLAFLLSACAAQADQTTSASENVYLTTQYRKVLEVLDSCPWTLSEKNSESPFNLADYAGSRDLSQANESIRKMLFKHESEYFPQERSDFGTDMQTWGVPYRQCSFDFSKNTPGKYSRPQEGLTWRTTEYIGKRSWDKSYKFPYHVAGEVGYYASGMNWPVRGSLFGSKASDVSEMAQAIANHYHGQVLLHGFYLWSLDGSLSGGDGALVVLPDGISHILIEFHEGDMYGKRKTKYDRIQIFLRQFPDRYWPEAIKAVESKMVFLHFSSEGPNRPPPCFLYSCFWQIDTGLREGRSRFDHFKDYSEGLEVIQKAANAEMAFMNKYEAIPMPPWPDEVTDKIFSAYAAHFLKDRTEVDAARKEKGRIDKRRADADQRRLEGGKSWSDIIHETLPEAMTEVRRDWAETSRTLEQSYESNMSRVGTGSGYVSTYTPPDFSNQTAAEKEKEAQEKSKKSFMAQQWTKYRQCKRDGYKWVGGKNEYVVGGYCDKKSAKPVTSQRTTTASTGDNSFDKEQACYAKGRADHRYLNGECIKLGPIQDEAMAYCWPTQNAKGWFCDGPIQVLQISEPDIQTALKRVGCEKGYHPYLTDGANWLHCGFGLENYDRDTWKIRRGSEHRGATQFQCRYSHTGRCENISTSTNY